MMAIDYSDCIRTIREGPVKIIDGYKDPKRKYLKAFCGSSYCGDEPARLEIYELSKSVNREKLMIRRILFTNVKNISHTEERQGEIITIKMQKDDNPLLFYADSQQSTMKWYRYCSLLYKIPFYEIPEIPKGKIALRQPGIDRYCELHKCDTANKWVVNILSEGIKSRMIGLFQLSVVFLCHDTSTFNIYGFYTGENSLTWSRGGIKRSGCIESLIFIEVDETCHGGPGLLWMECAIPQWAVELQKQIHELSSVCNQEHKTAAGSAGSPVGYVFVDYIMNGICKNDKDQELSQTPYENQKSDALLLGHTPTSQSFTSFSSKCSSGYFSDTSSASGSISLTTSQSYFPEDTCKKQSTCDTFPLSSKNRLSIKPGATVRNDKVINSSKSSLENDPVQTEPATSSTNTVLQQSKLKTPSSSPKSCSKETSNTRIPRPPNNKHTSIYSTPKCHHSAGSMFPLKSSVQDDKLLSSCSKQKATVASTSKDQLFKIAFQKCSVVITENLDVSAILPHLNSKGLLTPNDYQTLRKASSTMMEKAQYLLEVLPRKNTGSLEKFQECLCETQQGTGHGDILKALSKQYDQEVKKRNSQTHNPHSMTKKKY